MPALTQSRIFESVRAQRLGAALLGLFSVLLASPGHALDIPDVPLQSSVSVPPNIMFILDDSGSMHGEIMPDASIDGITTKSSGVRWRPTNIGRVFPLVPGLYGGGTDYDNIVADPNNVYGKIVRTATFNAQYYNPSVEYRPWVDAFGGPYPQANPECAYWNPEDPGKGCVNLTKSKTYSGVSGLWWQRTSEDNTCKNSACVVESGERTIEFNVYYTYNDNGKYEDGNYTKHVVSGGELNNFANWFQYYRTRILASRGGIGRAFSSLPRDAEIAPRVGYATLNSSPRVVVGVRPFAGVDREKFYKHLYTGVVNGGVGTPGREALKSVGDYYESETGVNDPWRTDVGDSGGANYSQRLECRQSFAMLMTDGYWSSNDNFSIASGDSAAGYPFQDSYDNTLADVAYHYWNRDLRPGMENKVPATSLNPQTHQHMVTYGIGLGVEGTISSEFAFSQIGKSSGTLVWPNPESNEEHKIDDLLHAAVNSRGGFYSAADPETFARELRAALSSIIERVESGSNVAANSVRLDAETRIFQASYVGGRWTGQLASYPVVNGRVSTTPSWLASEKLPGYATRKSNVFTLGGTFASQRGDDLGADLVDYILGRQSNEQQNGGSFRDRSSVLGDIVNSSPAFTNETSPATIFIGANDGMLHAFNANTGAELFAYIPSANLIPDAKLKELARPDYEHLFFVDGPITVSSRSRTSGKNLLVGTLGRGGAGLFALDVSNPASFNQSDVLWEASPSAAPKSWTKSDREDLGLILNKPLIVRTNKKGQGQDPSPAMAIFGNGINSHSGDAALFIVNAETGALVKKITADGDGNNGLTSIQAWDEDGDDIHDFVFAGDLKGNVWKFDLDFDDEKHWGLADGGKAQGNATRVSGGDPLIATGRPITGGLQIAFEPRTFQRWVFFGTGKYLEAGDPLTTDQQRWYGVKDTGEKVTSHAQLTQRVIELRNTIDGHAVRAFQPYQALDLDSRGWYVNLDVPKNGAPSERMVSDPLMVGRTLVAASILPSSDPCLSGGTGYLNAIDAFSGTATQAGFFDVDGDGEFDDDMLGGDSESRPVGSVDLNISMPTSPTVVENLLVAGGSLGTSGEVGIHNPLIKGRISWREIVGD